MRNQTAAMVAALATLAVLAIAGTSSAAATLPGNHFQVATVQYFLDSAATGGVKQLSMQAPASQSNTVFLAPGAQVLGVINQPSTDEWATPTGWAKDMEITDAAQAILYFTANAQAVTV